MLWAVIAVGGTLAERLVVAENGYGIYPCWAVPPLAVAWFVRWRIRRARLGGRPDPHRRSEHVFNGAYWAVCVLLLTVFSFHVDGWCGHGRMWGFGPIGWGYSTIGSPCNAPTIRYWNVSERWYVWYQPGE